MNLNRYSKITSNFDNKRILIASKLVDQVLKESEISSYKLIKNVDALGRDINSNHSFMIYFYEDGSVKKKYIFK